MTHRDEAERLAEYDEQLSAICGQVPKYAPVLRSMAAEIERLQDYDTRLTAVMPEDFKDWHQNSKAELPEVAAGVITSLREHINFYIEYLDRKDAEIERKDALLRDAEQLCDWISETPHQRGSINGIASQLGYNIKTELGGNHG